MVPTKLYIVFACIAFRVRACSTGFDCSLNGVCTSNSCVCDSPWVGPACGTLQYAVTPASGKNLWTGSENLNTWNGPILQGGDGLYHLYDPVYEHASLWKVIYYAHGTSSSPTGPFEFTSEANISSTTINPAGLVYPGASAGSSVYSLWIGADILISSSADGPFVQTYKSPLGSNPAPTYSAGKFYVTDQGTTKLYETTALDQPWVLVGNITHPSLPYTVEDPFLYVDNRGAFHVINHAYNTNQKVNCSSSHVSSHFFSSDGKTWGWSDAPYGHTVEFDDGTSHSYCTLERPNLVFNAAGFISHIHFAVSSSSFDHHLSLHTSLPPPLMAY